MRSSSTDLGANVLINESFPRAHHILVVFSQLSKTGGELLFAKSSSRVLCKCSFEFLFKCRNSQLKTKQLSVGECRRSDSGVAVQSQVFSFVEADK